MRDSALARVYHRIMRDSWSLVEIQFLLHIEVLMAGYFSYSHQIWSVRKIFTIHVIACVVALLLCDYGCCSRAKEKCKREREGWRTTSSSVADRCSIRLKLTWVQQRQHHRAHQSAREKILSLALRVGSIPTLHLKTFEQIFWTMTWRKNSRKAPWQMQSRYLCHCAFLVSLRYAGSEKTWPNHFISISLALVTLPAVLRR